MRRTNRRSIGSFKKPRVGYPPKPQAHKPQAENQNRNLISYVKNDKIKDNDIEKAEFHYNPIFRDKKQYFLSEVFDFVDKNRKLLFYYALFLFGVVLGVLVFNVSKDLLLKDLNLILGTEPVTGGIKGGISSIISSSFSTVMLLLVLFICGLSACGVPIAVLVPIFFGLGIGLSSAFHYSGGLGGIAVNAVLIIPHSIVSSVAIVLGTIESVKMSTSLSGFLISKSADNEGLHNNFKIYYLRFLLFLVLGVISGIVDIIFKIVFSKLIS